MSNRQTEQRIFDFVREHIREEGRSPSFEEIRAGVGLGSTSTVAYHVGELVKAGRFEPRKGGRRKVRALRLVIGEHEECPYCGR